MAKRGKVLRDPHFGPGLLMVEGKQYPFQMEGLWRSEVPAKPGLVVNVDFDTQGNLHGITAVPQAQLDQEQAELARARHGTRNRVFECRVSGIGQLAAVGVLVVSWFFVTAVSIHLPSLGNLDLTFWQILGYLNAGNSLQLLEVNGSPDSGIFGFLAILVLAGLFLPYVWKDRRALLGGILPLSFIALVGCLVGTSLHAVLANQPTDTYEHLRYGIFNVLSVGLGTYLSVSLAIYFAVMSTKQFMQSPGPREKPMGRSQKVAA